MSIERSQGVILRTRLLTETSLIVHWLTADQGRIATVAKGARRPKSPFRGRLDLFHEAEFSFQRSRRSDLHTLREVLVTETHSGLRTSFDCLRQAAYATALLEVAAEAESPVPALHRLLRTLLDCLGRGRSSPLLLFAFELQLLEASGLAPDLDSSRLSEGSRELARALAGYPLDEALDQPPVPAQVAELDCFLREFLAWHLERVPRGRAAALEAVSR